MEKKLFRSQSDRIVAGVCGGLSEYFEIDSTIVRIIFVLLAIVPSSPALLVYIIMAFVVPSRTLKEGEKARTNSFNGDIKFCSGPFFGYLLVFLGLIWLFENLFDFSDFWKYWPLILVAFGVAIAISGVNKEKS